MVEGKHERKRIPWKIGKREGLCGLILLLVLVVLGVLWPPYFYLNDDIAMRSILSGAYTRTPDGHVVYMKYPLTGVLALLYFILPQIPWMELFFAGCIWVSMCMFANRFSDLWMGTFLAVVLFLPFYLAMHYTIVAAITAAVAVFCLCDRKQRIGPLILLWIAYMIRGQVGLLALPFVLAAYVWTGLQASGAERRQVMLGQLRQCLLLLFGMAVISGVHHVCYSGEDWQAYLEYNEARTDLYDYTNFLSTDRYRKEYAAYGMTGEEAALLSSYNTMLAEDPDTDRVSEIARMVAAEMKKNEPTGFGNILHKYYLEIRYQNAPYLYLWGLLLLVLALSMMFEKKWLQFAFLGILGIGRSGIWMYFIGQGRFPERVSLSLYLLELLLLIAVFLDKKTLFQKERVQFLAQTALSVGVLFVAGFIFLNIPQKSTERMEQQLGWELLKAHAGENTDKTYLMDVFSVVGYADSLYEEDASNMMLMGGWLTGSPLARERLEQLGGKDAAQVLYENRDARLVVRQGYDITWLETYLQTRFGDCRLVVTNQIVWEQGGLLILKVQSDVAQNGTM